MWSKYSLTTNALQQISSSLLFWSKKQKRFRPANWFTWLCEHFCAVGRTWKIVVHSDIKGLIFIALSYNVLRSCSCSSYGSLNHNIQLYTSQHQLTIFPVYLRIFPAHFSHHNMMSFLYHWWKHYISHKLLNTCLSDKKQLSLTKLQIQVLHSLPYTLVQSCTLPPTLLKLAHVWVTVKMLYKVRRLWLLCCRKQRKTYKKKYFALY